MAMVWVTRRGGGLLARDEQSMKLIYYPVQENTPRKGKYSMSTMNSSEFNYLSFDYDFFDHTIMLGKSVKYCLARPGVMLMVALLGLAILSIWLAQSGLSDQIISHNYQSELMNITGLITVHQFTMTECISGSVIQKWSGHYKTRQGISNPGNLSMETDDERKQVF